MREAARIFGDQCITVSIDYQQVSPRRAQRVHRRRPRAGALDPVEWALRCQDLHCGEILLGSIDRDGTMNGYDLDMIHRLGNRLTCP